MRSSRRVGGITTPSSASIARVGGQAAGLRAADVGMVRARGREAELRARDEGDVGQVRPAGVRVVEDEDVVRRRVVRR